MNAHLNSIPALWSSVWAEHVVPHLDLNGIIYHLKCLIWYTKIFLYDIYETLIV